MSEEEVSSQSGIARNVENSHLLKRLIKKPCSEEKD
jgi:hypothetical protein